MFPSEQFDLCKLTDDNQKPFNGEFGDLDNIYFDLASPPFQSLLRSTDFQNEKASPLASLGIIKDFASRSRKLNGEKIHIPCRKSEAREKNEQKLSTNARIRMAGQYFIDSYSSKVDEISDLSHPLPVTFSGLSDDETKDVELLLTLLSSAEKTSEQQFDRASNLIELCNNMSSNEGNTVERLVYYFSEAIREKINRETGRVAGDGVKKMQNFDLQEALMNVDSSILAFHQQVPFSQVCQFTAMHTILENVRESRKLHIIDLEIRMGIQYAVLMQTIKNRCELQIEHLKITAIGTRLESKIKDTCDRLADVAQSMNISFSSNIVMVVDILDFNINLLKLENDEKVAVYSPFILSSLIVKPNRLEHLMREIRKINPCVTLISEVEANHTSLAFVNRFIEALFFYGALFDSMSDCLANDDLSRKVLESVFYGQPIRNIVAADGDQRTIRHISIDVWRAFFARFGMSEVELSIASLDEAKLLISNFDSGNSCTLRVDGNCFIVGWKDVSIFSASAWKFV